MGTTSGLIAATVFFVMAGEWLGPIVSNMCLRANLVFRRIIDNRTIKTHDGIVVTWMHEVNIALHTDTSSKYQLDIAHGMRHCFSGHKNEALFST
jgi:hypothetical protein